MKQTSIRSLRQFWFFVLIKAPSHSQRLGGLMSITDRVGAAVGLGLGSMSLPLRGLLAGPGASSRSGVKTLLPLLVLGDCSVGLKLTGERKPWTCVRRARGNVFLPAEQQSSAQSESQFYRSGGVKGRLPTITVVLKAEGNAVSTRVRSTFTRLLKDWDVVFYRGRGGRGRTQSNNN